MSANNRKLVFFGNERLATGTTTTAPTLRALVAAGYEVCAVVANHDKSVSRNSRTLEIQGVAETLCIPVLLPKSPADIIHELKSYEAEAGILVAYGRIIPQSIIDIFPAGIINLHPSLLPLHRGPTPIESVILEGAVKTGMSVMQLVKAMDAGPVFAQRQLPLSGNASKQHLADTLLQMGAEMLIDLLPEILDQTIIPTAQDESRATYDNLIDKNAGVIDWDKPAEQLAREVRAYADWPKSRTLLGGIDVTITDAVAVADQVNGSKPGDIEAAHGGGTIGVATGNGTLWIKSLKPAGKNEMTVKAFLAGYGNRLFTRPSE